MTNATFLQETQTTLTELQGVRRKLLSDIEEKNQELQRKNEYSWQVQQAATIIQTAARQTQEQLRYVLEDIVNVALETIFANPYHFVLEFLTQRDRTVVVPKLERNGEQFDIIDEAGGGVADVVAFALRLAIWVLGGKKQRNFFVFDEPFKFLSVDLQETVTTLLKELSKELALTFLIVTHNQILIKNADHAFMVENGALKTVDK